MAWYVLFPIHAWSSARLTGETSPIDTYGGFYPDGTLSQGGYSSHIRAHEHFTFPIPEALETDRAAPMLCAGLTAYSPLVRNGAGPGKKIGVVGVYVIIFKSLSVTVN